MNTIEKIQTLFKQYGESVQIGKFLGIISKGWLSITEKECCYSVLYTSEKDAHYPLKSGGPALEIDFNKVTGERHRSLGFTGAWKTALSMWPVYNEQEANEVYDTVKSYVDKAYNYNFK